MPGVVIGGHQVTVPGLDVRNWFDDGALRLKPGEDLRRRYTDWVRGICLHTTKGWPDRDHPRSMYVLPGLGKGGKDVATVRYWATSSRKAGAHLVVDNDGSVVCCADLAREAAYHAGEVNEVSIGIEIYQGADAELYAGQLDAMVRLLDFLTRHFGIQRQFQRRYIDEPVPRIATGAQDVVGIYGHRDVTTNRGTGDPGRLRLRLAGAGGLRGLLLRHGRRQGHLAGAAAGPRHGRGGAQRRPRPGHGARARPGGPCAWPVGRAPGR